MSQKDKARVHYTIGAVNNSKQNQLDNQRDAWKEDADCGCGIDCCNKTLVLEDQDVKGDIYEVSIKNGAITLTKRS